MMMKYYSQLEYPGNRLMDSKQKNGQHSQSDFAKHIKKNVGLYKIKKCLRKSTSKQISVIKSSN